jgi:hypothetical protein
MGGEWVNLVGFFLFGVCLLSSPSSLGMHATRLVVDDGDGAMR